MPIFPRCTVNTSVTKLNVMKYYGVFADFYGFDRKSIEYIKVIYGASRRKRKSHRKFVIS